MVRKASYSKQRSQVLQAAQAWLQQPSHPGNWRDALDHVRKLTAIVGVQPDIRREDARIIEVTSTSLYTGFALYVGDKRVTPREGKRLLAWEGPEVPVVEEREEDEFARLTLDEEELAAVLEKLHLTEGWQ